MTFGILFFIPKSDDGIVFHLSVPFLVMNLDYIAIIVQICFLSIQFKEFIVLLTFLNVKVLDIFLMEIHLSLQIVDLTWLKNTIIGINKLSNDLHSDETPVSTIRIVDALFVAHVFRKW